MQAQHMTPSLHLQVRFRPGNIWHLGSRQLELLQFHFHSPSEHAMDGRRDAMEAHLVHKDKDKGERVLTDDSCVVEPGVQHLMVRSCTGEGSW